MKKFLYLIIGVPVAIFLIVLSVANRQDVTFRLDPFNAADPAISVTLPFFVFLFVTFLAGIVLGGCVAWFSQGKARRAARHEKVRANELEQKAKAERKRADQLAATGGVPAIGSGLSNKNAA